MTIPISHPSSSALSVVCLSVCLFVVYCSIYLAAGCCSSSLHIVRYFYFASLTFRRLRLRLRLRFRLPTLLKHYVTSHYTYALHLPLPSPSASASLCLCAVPVQPYLQNNYSSIHPSLLISSNHSAHCYYLIDLRLVATSKQNRHDEPISPYPGAGLLQVHAQKKVKQHHLSRTPRVHRADKRSGCPA